MTCTLHNWTFTLKGAQADVYRCDLCGAVGHKTDKDKKVRVVMSKIPSFGFMPDEIANFPGQPDVPTKNRYGR